MSGIQSFDPKSSPNGPVASTSVPNGAHSDPGLLPGDSGKASGGTPSSVARASGTENLNANGSVKNATPQSVPSGTGGKTPAGVQSYNDSSV